MIAQASTFERIQAREAVRAQLFGGTTDLRLGRYEVRGLLGRGGLGVVYRAHDPLLDRDVALKVLHGEHGGGTDARAALVTEARSLARVSSPDIVPVFDVGQADGRLFLAMELVVGQDLRKWLAASKRSTDEVIAVFLGAARGLEAVHAAGLIHRDFKPENVLLGADGRARVADFGLARLADGLPSARDPNQPSSEQHPSTRTAAIAGTPAYMAPELFAGEPASIASDVYAFAVSLFEGLYRRRPYVGSSLPALLEAAERGVIDRSGLIGVSPRVRDVVLRGLAPKPSKRWPDIAAFASALVDASRPRRWRIARRLGGVVLAGGAIAGLLTRPQPPDPCAAALEHFERDLDPSYDAALARALPGRATAKDRVAVRFDALDGSWRDVHAEVCRTPDDRDTESKLSCLGGIARQLAATKRALVTTEGLDPGAALDVADALDEPSVCLDRGGDAEAVAPSEALADQIAAAQALVELGDYAGALAAADAALAQADPARDRGAMPALLWIRGIARLNHGDGVGAMEDNEAAFHIAVVVHNADIAAQTADVLAYEHAHRRNDPETGAQWLRTAQTWIARGATAIGPSELAVTAAAIDEANNEHTSAVLRLREALAAETCTDCAAKFNLLEALVALSARDEVLPYAETAYALQLGRYGEGSVSAIEAGAVLASAQYMTGRHDDAIATATAAIEDASALEAFDPLRLASMYDTIGSAYVASGRSELAIPQLERAIEVVSVPGVSESRYVISLRYNLARTFELTHDPRAIDQLHMVVAALEADAGGESADLAVVLSTLAAAELADGRGAAALATIRRASGIVASHPNTDAFKDVTIHYRHGTVALSVDPGEARIAFDRALARVPDGPEHDGMRASVREGRAKACVALGERCD